jgi:glycosyltransferase involved in cell wall biosynthesis
MRTLFVVPAHNEGNVLGGVLDDLKALKVGDVLVVDDGSSDNTCDVAVSGGVRCVRHFMNLGLGASIATGFEVARREGFDVVVTFDADGQHNPADVLKLLERLGRGDVDVVIGDRCLNNGNGASYGSVRKSQPLSKGFGNFCLNLINSLFFGAPYCDSQSGLRAFNRHAIELIKVRSNRYAVSSEILLEVKENKLRLAEVPVEVIYTAHSITKGTRVKHGVEIFIDMLARSLRGR